MTQMQSTAGSRPGEQSNVGHAGAIPVVILGLSLSLFFVISYLICIAGYLLLPGFELLSWRSFFLGLIESFIWGWYIALVFGSLYNFFSRRIER